MKTWSVAVVGATGLVGSTLLSLLAQRNFPVHQLYLLASHQSAGKTISFQDKQYQIHDLATFDFSRTQLSFFCVGNELASEFAPKAALAGNVVIDKSFHFRNNIDIPLIVPEVNDHAISQYKNKNIISNPNCTTIPIAVALKPIYDAVGISRVNVATYQSVSGTGKEAVHELTEQTRQWLANEPIRSKIYSQQIAFNVLPHCDDFQENGYTREEMKIVREIQKIFDDATIAVNPTAVRVPVFYGHAVSIHLETKDKITAAQALQLLKRAAGVRLMTGEFPYPTPVLNAAGSDDVYVGRVREDISHEKGLNLWIVSDNLRKGAALNAVQIMEQLITKYL